MTDIQKKIYAQIEDANKDGIRESIAIYIKNTSLPLFGSHLGVEMLRINFIPFDRSSKVFAVNLAKTLLKTIRENYGHYTKSKGNF